MFFFNLNTFYLLSLIFFQSQISPAGMACTAHSNLHGQGHSHSGFSGGHFQNGGSSGATVHHNSSFAAPMRTTASSSSRNEALQTSTNTSVTSSGGYVTFASSNNQTAGQNIPTNGQSKYLAGNSNQNGGGGMKTDDNLTQFFDLLSSEKDLKSGKTFFFAKYVLFFL